ncbi:hypothetical protein Cadr_000020290 [Camelus dromedarius]|uniref:Uncharacterized protein n=1 Tax=Camelus dromedarius TaxID=9838 RepID=A0A5N4CYW7_CAMDR|nr:hypothetical protein Cadr_000020290 [Camelus dromedarius]
MAGRRKAGGPCRITAHSLSLLGLPGHKGCGVFPEKTSALTGCEDKQGKPDAGGRDGTPPSREGHSKDTGKDGQGDFSLKSGQMQRRRGGNHREDFRGNWYPVAQTSLSLRPSLRLSVQPAHPYHVQGPKGPEGKLIPRTTTVLTETRPFLGLLHLPHSPPQPRVSARALDREPLRSKPREEVLCLVGGQRRLHKVKDDSRQRDQVQRWEKSRGFEGPERLEWMCPLTPESAGLRLRRMGACWRCWAPEGRGDGGVWRIWLRFRGEGEVVGQGRGDRGTGSVLRGRRSRCGVSCGGCQPTAPDSPVRTTRMFIGVLTQRHRPVMCVPDNWHLEKGCAQECVRMGRRSRPFSQSPGQGTIEVKSEGTEEVLCLVGGQRRLHKVKDDSRQRDQVQRWEKSRGFEGPERLEWMCPLTPESAGLRLRRMGACWRCWAPEGRGDGGVWRIWLRFRGEGEVVGQGRGDRRDRECPQRKEEQVWGPRLSAQPTAPDSPVRTTRMFIGVLTQRHRPVMCVPDNWHLEKGCAQECVRMGRRSRPCAPVQALCTMRRVLGGRWEVTQERDTRGKVEESCFTGQRVHRQQASSFGIYGCDIFNLRKAEKTRSGDRCSHAPHWLMVRSREQDGVALVSGDKLGGKAKMEEGLAGGCVVNTLLQLDSQEVTDTAWFLHLLEDSTLWSNPANETPHGAQKRPRCKSSSHPGRGQGWGRWGRLLLEQLHQAQAEHKGGLGDHGDPEGQPLRGPLATVATAAGTSGALGQRPGPEL